MNSFETLEWLTEATSATKRSDVWTAGLVSCSKCWVTTAHPVQRLGTDHMAARAGFHWDLHHHEHSGDISRQDPAIYFFQKAVGAHVQRNGSNVAPNFVS